MLIMRERGERPVVGVRGEDDVAADESCGGQVQHPAVDASGEAE
jgi:hypothetical protein